MERCLLGRLYDEGGAPVLESLSYGLRHHDATICRGALEAAGGLNAVVFKEAANVAYMVKYMFRESLPLARERFGGYLEEKSNFVRIPHAKKQLEVLTNLIQATFEAYGEVGISPRACAPPVARGGTKKQWENGVPSLHLHVQLKHL